ncbi:MAG: hypothetical protein AB1546_04720 [bacterium]
MKKAAVLLIKCLAICSFICAVFASPVIAVEPVTVKLTTMEDNIKCYVCHADPKMKARLSSGKLRSFYIDKGIFENSTHGSHTCTSCHKDIVQVPHGSGIKSVNCASCHYVENIYGAPTSKEFVERYVKYQKSVHKKELDAGNPDAPACQDCHGSHDIVKPSRPESRINRKNIPKTCGRCHLDEYTAYRTSIHGEMHDKGFMRAAICTDCHGEHNIQATASRASSVFFTAIPETCGKCHKEEKVMSKFGISAEQYKTYRESYHGKASRFGVTTVANCASCHGFHDIRPPDDPKSSVNRKNLPKTCGKCHKGTNINYSRGKMHIEASQKDAGAVYWIALAFKILTLGTILALIAHIILDLLRRILSRKDYGRE